MANFLLKDDIERAQGHFFANIDKYNIVSQAKNYTLQQKNKKIVLKKLHGTGFSKVPNN